MIGMRMVEAEQFGAGRVGARARPASSPIAHAETAARTFVGDVRQRHRRRHLAVAADQRTAALVRIGFDAVRADRVGDRPAPS